MFYPQTDWFSAILQTLGQHGWESGIADSSGLSVPLSKFVFLREKPHDRSREQSGRKRWEESPSREIQEHPSLQKQFALSAKFAAVFQWVEEKSISVSLRKLNEQRGHAGFSCLAAWGLPAHNVLWPRGASAALGRLFSLWLSQDLLCQQNPELRCLTCHPQARFVT